MAEEEAGGNSSVRYTVRELIEALRAELREGLVDIKKSSIAIDYRLLATEQRIAVHETARGHPEGITMLTQLEKDVDALGRQAVLLQQGISGLAQLTNDVDTLSRQTALLRQADDFAQESGANRRWLIALTASSALGLLGSAISIVMRGSH